MERLERDFPLIKFEISPDAKNGSIRGNDGHEQQRIDASGQKFLVRKVC